MYCDFGRLFDETEDEVNYHLSETSAYECPGGDLRWRSSLRLAPAPPIYGVMGDYGSPPGHPAASQCHVDLRTFASNSHVVLELWGRVPSADS